jgi:isocitrate dehydrogenase kinase/phosphatase
MTSLAPYVVTLIYAAYDSYKVQFEAITMKARARFEQRDWLGAQSDARDRLALYKSNVDQAVALVRQVLADVAHDPAVWTEAKSAYARLIAGREDGELAETFFNSITRRIFHTVGVDAGVEFVSRLGDQPPGVDGAAVYEVFEHTEPTDAVVRRILGFFPWDAAWADLDRDVHLASRAIESELRRAERPLQIRSVDVVRAIFYRNKGAYIVARIHTGDDETPTLPLVLPLLHGERGIEVDAVLLTEDEASIVFGFTWSYFRVDAPRPRALVEFLKSIMPLKRVDELYNAIGFHKHGKTELYRSLLEHLALPNAKFEVAEGDAGLVMSVFTLPSLNVVFKIIKDTFGATKTTTRSAVMGKYQLVFVRDRVGRLADAQEFEHLEFRRECFSDALLAELLRDAPRIVRVEGDRVVVRHLYTERRVTPLNLYLKRTDLAAAKEAVVDYGNAIKELAAANIFAGDMLLKNFGVSRHRRVLFYDYDELSLLTECRFREIPASRHDGDDTAAEPWFGVAENDVFPEEFGAFMIPPGDLREAFLSRHADLLGVAYWRDMQDRQAKGELVDVFPYRPERRLHF